MPRKATTPRPSRAITALPVIPICPTCDKPHATHQGRQACIRHITGGRTRTADAGRGCRKPAVPGTTVCVKHGGNTFREAGARRLAEGKAAQAMRRFGGPIETTASEALLDTVKWTAGYVAWLREKVAEVNADDKLVWGKTRTKTGGDDRGTTYEAKPNAWLVLLGEWHDKLVKVCAAAIKAGIEERKVRLAEQQGALVAEVIRGILGELGLTAEQAARVPEVVPRHLRLLIGGAA